MTALRVRDLAQQHGPVVALHGLDLDVEPGKIVGLLGPNGAGKSSAMRLLSGEDRVLRGTILLGCEDVTSWPVYRRVRSGLGYVAQSPSVVPELSVYDNVVLGLADTSGVHGWLEAADLLGLAGRRAAILSGGERRRLEIVRALARGPKVLLLDEPFAGLDPIHVGWAEHALRGAAERGVAVVLSDHQVASTSRLCHEIVLLLSGRVEVRGSPAAVRANAEAVKQFFGHDSC